MIQSFAYEKKEDSAVIWRCFSYAAKVVVPEEIEGLRVEGLAPYAFSAHMDEKELEEGIRSGRIRISQSDWLDMQEERTAAAGNTLKELELPSSVTVVGRYCFYNCNALEQLTFSAGLHDWGSGAFTGCHHLRHLIIDPGAEEATSLKDVLDELPEELCVDYGAAKLMMPEYYEEGVENTPARILETHVHGTGMRYRNCFQGKKFDFGQYDSLFYYATVQENEELTEKLAMYRLRYPQELSGAAQEQYEDYVIRHARNYALLFTKERDMDGIQWIFELLQSKCNGRAAEADGARKPEAVDISQAISGFLEQMTEAAGKSGFTEGLGLIMDYCHRLGAPLKKKRRLEL